MILSALQNRFKTLQFPHISRLFPSSPVSSFSMLVLWFVAAFVGSINVFSISDRVPSQPSAATVISRAYRLWSLQKKPEAALLLSSSYSLFGSQVLGMTTNPADTIALWEHEHKNNELAFQYWTQLTEQYPSFRDAFIQGAYYAQKLGKLQIAHEYTRRANTIDPLFAVE